VRRKSVMITGLLILIIASQPIVLRSQAASNQDDLVPAARAFVELLVKKDFANAVATFDDTMKTAMPEAKLQETWNAVVAQVGAFKQIVKTRTEKRGAYTIVFVTSEFQNAALDIKVVFDQSKRIAGLFFAPVTNVDSRRRLTSRQTHFARKR
jgi:hypothetical protein